MPGLNDYPDARPEGVTLLEALTFTHPDDVLQSSHLTDAQKRAILASWASDAHAVPNLPALRQLDSGAIVTLDTVLDALRSLDGAAPAGSKIPVWPVSAFKRSRPALAARWRRSLRRRSDDDDDDPPPCPASALPPGVELELRRRRDATWQAAAA